MLYKWDKQLGQPIELYISDCTYLLLGTKSARFRFSGDAVLWSPLLSMSRHIFVQEMRVPKEGGVFWSIAGVLKPTTNSGSNSLISMLCNEETNNNGVNNFTYQREETKTLVEMKIKKSIWRQGRAWWRQINQLLMVTKDITAEGDEGETWHIHAIIKQVAIKKLPSG